MRRSRQEKSATHDALLQQASRLFRANGIEATSVSDVMAKAGLTHGGFYRHFENKEALIGEAIHQTFDSLLDDIERQSETNGPKQAVHDYLDFYLSEKHLIHPADGCPVPTLAAEVARSSEKIKEKFSQSLRRTIDVLAQGMSGTDENAKTKAIQALALRVGAVLIARACNEKLAKDVLDACR